MNVVTAATAPTAAPRARGTSPAAAGRDEFASLLAGLAGASSSTAAPQPPVDEAPTDAPPADQSAEGRPEHDAHALVVPVPLSEPVVAPPTTTHAPTPAAVGVVQTVPEHAPGAFPAVAAVPDPPAACSAAAPVLVSTHAPAAEPVTTGAPVVRQLDAPVDPTPTGAAPATAPASADPAAPAAPAAPTAPGAPTAPTAPSADVEPAPPATSVPPVAVPGLLGAGPVLTGTPDAVAPSVPADEPAPAPDVRTTAPHPGNAVEETAGDVGDAALPAATVTAPTATAGTAPAGAPLAEAPLVEAPLVAVPLGEVALAEAALGAALLVDAPLVDAPLVDAGPVASAPAIGAEVGVTGPQATDLRAAAPAAPAPAAPPPPPATQVVQLLTPVLEGPDGSYSLSLQLYPEELGAVQVEVLLRGGEIRLVMHAPDEAAQAALRSALPDLKADLQAGGLTATSLSVDDGRPGQSSDRWADRSPDRRSDGQGDPPARRAHPYRGAEPSARQPTSHADAALDLRM